MTRKSIGNLILLLFTALLSALIIVLIFAQKRESQNDFSKDGDVPLVNHPLWLSTEYANNANMTTIDKCSILNSMSKNNISSAFVFFNSSVWDGQYFMVQGNEEPQILEKLVKIYFDEDIVYSPCVLENYPEKDLYDYYITFTLANGQQYTIFFLKTFNQNVTEIDFAWFCGECFTVSKKIDSIIGDSTLNEIYQYYRRNGQIFIPEE